MRGKSTVSKETLSIEPPPLRDEKPKPIKPRKPTEKKSRWPQSLSGWRANYPNEQKWLAVLGLGIVLGVGLSLMLTYVLCVMVGFLLGWWWAKK